MNIYEEMVKFKYRHLTKQDWKDSTRAGLNYSFISEVLASKFKMNACEVTDNRTGFGSVFYREWP